MKLKKRILTILITIVVCTSMSTPVLTSFATGSSWSDAASDGASAVVKYTLKDLLIGGKGGKGSPILLSVLESFLPYPFSRVAGIFTTYFAKSITKSVLKGGKDKGSEDEEEGDFEKIEILLEAIYNTQQQINENTSLILGKLDNEELNNAVEQYNKEFQNMRKFYSYNWDFLYVIINKILDSVKELQDIFPNNYDFENSNPEKIKDILKEHNIKTNTYDELLYEQTTSTLANIFSYNEGKGKDICDDKTKKVNTTFYEQYMNFTDELLKMVVIPYTNDSYKACKPYELYSKVLEKNYDFNVQTFDKKQEFLDKIEDFYLFGYMMLEIAFDYDLNNETNCNNDYKKNYIAGLLDNLENRRKKLDEMMEESKESLEAEKKDAENRVYCYRNNTYYNRYLTPVNTFSSDYYLNLKSNQLTDFLYDDYNYTYETRLESEHYDKVRVAKYINGDEIINKEKCNITDDKINIDNFDFYKSIDYTCNEKNDISSLQEIAVNRNKLFSQLIKEIFLIKDADINNLEAEYAGIYKTGEFKSQIWKHFSIDELSLWEQFKGLFCDEYDSYLYYDYEISRTVNYLDWNEKKKTTKEIKKINHVQFNPLDSENNFKDDPRFPKNYVYTPSDLDKPLLIITKAEQE